VPTLLWWIDEPMVMGRSDPGDEDLGRIRSQGAVDESLKSPDSVSQQITGDREPPRIGLPLSNLL
jgi:hypothetical protein